MTWASPSCPVASRDKTMRIEKLVYVYWPERRRFVQLVVTCGKATLAALAVDVLRTLRRLSRPRQLRLILDAGASVSNETVESSPSFLQTVLIIRAPRQKAYVDAWKRVSLTPSARLSCAPRSPYRGSVDPTS